MGIIIFENEIYLSALVRMPTFCKILWHRLLISRSLQMSLTNSKMRSVSFKPWMSFLDRLRISWWLENSELAFGGLKKVGAPSTVVTKGLVNPPRSNSCAEIFRTGVPEPELKSELIGLIWGTLFRSEVSRTYFLIRHWHKPARWWLGWVRRSDR